MENNNKKILVTAYSHSGITRDLAKMIAKAVGGDFKAIIPKEKYPESYTDVLKKSKVEIDIKKEPELKDEINIDEYDVVFLGTPNWYSTIAPPVRTVLMQNDFSGKMVIPFCTHGGGGEARCLSTIKNLAQNAEVLEGLALYSGDVSQGRVDNFLNKTGLINN